MSFALTRRRVLLAGAALAAPYVTRSQAAIDDRMIGQMLVLGFAGANSGSADAQALARQIEAGVAGGACFLGHNTRSKQGIESLTALFNNAGGRSKPFVAVDQEGGAVQRLGKNSGYAALPAAQAVAARNDIDGARRLYNGLAAQLKGSGFNLNLAPDVDLGFEAANPIIAKWGRAFGPDGATVARYAGAFVEAHRAQRVLTAMKHFPGHGSTKIDSHARPVDITETWRPDELTPFRTLAQRGLIDVVMSGHLSHQKLTGGLPATLSPRAVEVMRRDVGFNGALMTDDLDMKAVRSLYPLNEAILRAIGAGYDLILLSNSLEPDPNLARKTIASVRAAVESGRIAASQIEAAAQRIAQLKSRV